MTLKNLDTLGALRLKSMYCNRATNAYCISSWKDTCQTMLTFSSDITENWLDNTPLINKLLKKSFFQHPKNAREVFIFQIRDGTATFFPQTLIHRHRHTNKSQKSALILTLSLPKMTNLTKQRKSLNPKLPNEI